MHRRLTAILLLALFAWSCGTPASKRFNRVPDSHRPTEEQMKEGREDAEKSEQEDEEEEEESEEDKAVDDSKPF